DKSPYHSLRREKRRQKRSLANQDDIHGKPTRRVELLLQTWCGAARNAALEFQDQPLRSDSPAMVRVGKRDGIRAFSIHLIPGLAPADRVIHPAGTYCESGGTRRIRHDRDTPTVSGGTAVALFPRLAAVVSVGGIGLYYLGMIIVAADNRHETYVSAELPTVV